MFEQIVNQKALQIEYQMLWQRWLNEPVEARKSFPDYCIWIRAQSAVLTCPEDCEAMGLEVEAQAEKFQKEKENDITITTSTEMP